MRYAAPRRDVLEAVRLAYQLELAGRTTESRTLWARLAFQLRQRPVREAVATDEPTRLVPWMVRYLLLALLAATAVTWVHSRGGASTNGGQGALSARRGSVDGNSDKIPSGQVRQNEPISDEGSQKMSDGSPPVGTNSLAETLAEAPISSLKVELKSQPAITAVAVSETLSWEPTLRCAGSRLAAAPGESRPFVFSIARSGTVRMLQLGMCREISQQIKGMTWRRTERKAVASALYNLARCTMPTAKRQDTLDLLQEARCYDHDFIAPLEMIASIFLDEGKKDIARKAIHEMERIGLEYEKRKSPVYAAMALDKAGVFRADVDEIDGALTNVQHAHRLDPDDEGIAANLAEFSLIGGQPATALELTERLLGRGLLEPGMVPVLRAVRFVAHVQAGDALPSAEAELDEIVAWHRENESVDAWWTWKHTVAWLRRTKESGLDRRFDLSLRLLAAFETPRAKRLSTLTNLRSDMSSESP